MHDHGSEYQLKVIFSDGKEDLTGWLDQEQIALVITSVKARGQAWLRERKVLCHSCPDQEPEILEFPVANTESIRYRPHDSRYLKAAGIRNRGEVAGGK